MEDRLGCVKRRDLLRRLELVARGRGSHLVLVRPGGQHDVFAVGSVRFTVPRHVEIDERTARAIILQASTTEEDGT